MYRSFVPGQFWGRRTRKRRLFGKKQSHIIKHIAGGSHEFRALLYETVGPDGRGIVDTAWHGVDRPSLLACLIRADQRAALSSRLDNEHTKRTSANDAVAHWKCLTIRLHLHRKFSNHRTGGGDFFRERLIFWRVNREEATADHSDRATLCRQSALMRGGINAPSEPTHDRHSGIR